MQLLRKSKFMSKKLILAIVLTLLLATVSFADQFQVVEYETARRAVEVIKWKPYLASYCSECDKQSVQIWKVKDALITTDDGKYFTVKIFGKRVYESQKIFDRGKYREPVQYMPSKYPTSNDEWFVQEIDLAYVYVPTGTRTFENLAQFMNLKPLNIQVAAINLPMDVIQ